MLREWESWSFEFREQARLFNLNIRMSFNVLFAGRSTRSTENLRIFRAELSRRYPKTQLTNVLVIFSLFRRKIYFNSICLSVHLYWNLKETEWNFYRFVIKINALVAGKSNSVYLFQLHSITSNIFEKTRNVHKRISKWMIFILLWTSSMPFRVNWIYVFKNLINPNLWRVTKFIFLYPETCSRFRMEFVLFLLLVYISFDCWFCVCEPENRDAVVNNHLHYVQNSFRWIFSGCCVKSQLEKRP